MFSAVKREGTKMFGSSGFSNNLTQRLLMASKASRTDVSESGDGGSSLSLGTMSMLDLEAA